MVDQESQAPDEAKLVFAAHNVHHPRCGRPPRLRNTDDPGLYHGYFENFHGEQFVFTFDRTSGTGTVAGGDLNWGNPKSFTLGEVDEALRSTQWLAAQIKGRGDAEAPVLPIIDAALALGRLTGLTGKEEVIWLRACLTACTLHTGMPQGRRGDQGA